MGPLATTFPSPFFLCPEPFFHRVLLRSVPPHYFEVFLPLFPFSQKRKNTQLFKCSSIPNFFFQPSTTMSLPAGQLVPVRFYLTLCLTHSGSSSLAMILFSFPFFFVWDLTLFALSPLVYLANQFQNLPLSVGMKKVKSVFRTPKPNSTKVEAQLSQSNGVLSPLRFCLFEFFL